RLSRRRSRLSILSWVSAQSILPVAGLFPAATHVPNAARRDENGVDGRDNPATGTWGYIVVGKRSPTSARRGRSSTEHPRHAELIGWVQAGQTGIRRERAIPRELPSQ